MDRFNPTTYQDEKKTLEMKNNNSYTLTGKPSGNQLETQVKLIKVNLEKEEASVNFLKKIPKEVVEEFCLKFKCEPDNITTKANSLFDYCQSKGRKYKNYKAFLSNALRKDFGERPPRKKVPIIENVDGIAKIVGYK